jgi:hypothetical protein
MTDVLEELHLRPIQIGQHLDPLPFQFVGDGVGQRHPDLSADELAKGPEIVVQRTVRVDAQDEGADRLGQLQKLGELRSSGVLTDAEFEAEKTRILEG